MKCYQRSSAADPGDLHDRLSMGHAHALTNDPTVDNSIRSRPQYMQQNIYVTNCGVA